MIPVWWLGKPQMPKSRWSNWSNNNSAAHHNTTWLARFVAVSTRLSVMRSGLTGIRLCVVLQAHSDLAAATP
jgi:hypothetical protein